MRDRRERKKNLGNNIGTSETLVFDHVVTQEFCNSLGCGDGIGFSFSIFFHLLRHAVPLSEKTQEFMVIDGFALGIDDIEPIICNRGSTPVRLFEVGPIQESLKDLRLKGFDQFQFSSPLDLEPFQF